jgi:hypothetical protein
LEKVDPRVDVDETEDEIWKAMSKSVGLADISEGVSSPEEYDEFLEMESNSDTDASDLEDTTEDNLFIDDEGENDSSEDNPSRDDIEDNPNQDDQPDKSKTLKLPRRIQKFSKIATELGYKGDYFSNQAGDFASADDFEELLNDENLEAIEAKPVPKRKKLQDLLNGKRFKRSKN